LRDEEPKNRMEPASTLLEFSLRLQAYLQAPALWQTLLRDEVFNEFALNLFHLQLEENSAYRQFVEGAGASVTRIDHWTRIPAAPTSGFKEFDFSCLALGERKRVFYSSGTTSQTPSRHFHNELSFRVYEDSLYAWFDAQVLKHMGPGGPGACLVLTPASAEAPTSSLIHMFDVIQRRLRCPFTRFTARVNPDASWQVEPEATVEALREIVTAGQPALVLGTAFSFVHLLDYLGERKLRIQLPPDSVVMETGGYKGRSRTVPKPELHAQIKRCLGIHSTGLVSEYGMSELSSQAYERAGESAFSKLPASRGGFRFPPWARMQVISSETGKEQKPGEPGLIRVYDLANTFSVMAVQTEDLAVSRGGGFELIGRASGVESRGCSLMQAV
jgi:hypothetical protein